MNPIARYFLSLVRPPEIPETPEAFTNADLRGARFVDSDLAGSWLQEVSFQYARLRGVDLVNAEIWGAVSGLRINGVEVEPLIEAELERRFPGRATLFASDPDGVRAAWATIERLWALTLERALALPETALHERLHEGEWSFLETLRHLVLVDDGFVRQVRDRDLRMYRQGVPHTPTRGYFASILDLDADPSSDEVVTRRSAGMAAVRAIVDGLDAAELQRVAPVTEHDHSGFDLPVLWCFWRLVNEEWEHHSFALRDVEALEAVSSQRP
jgi:hypothetical protein